MENTFVGVVNGIEVTYEILFTFDNEELKRTYVAYTDHQKDKDGKENIYMGYINPYANDFELLPVTTPEEISMFNDVLAEIQGKLSNINK